MGRKQWLGWYEPSAVFARYEAAARKKALPAKKMSAASLAKLRDEMRAAREGDLAGSYVRVGGNLCVYCGLASEVLDHVPPLAVARKFTFGSRWLYPACRECNGRLGAFAERCLKARALYLFVRAAKQPFDLRYEDLAAHWKCAVQLCRCEVCEHERALVDQARDVAAEP